MSTPCILVVDDDPGMRALLRNMLTRNEYNVLLAENGEQALKIIEGYQLDAIICDVAMPLLNGYELFKIVCKKASSNPRLALTPFFFLTARKEDTDIRHGKSLGVHDYLVKPICERDLIAVLEGRLYSRQIVLDALQSVDTSLEGMDELIFTINGHKLVVNCAQHKLFINNNEECSTSARVIFLLETLCQRPNKVIGFTDLVQVTHQRYTDDVVDAGNLLRPMVRNLRTVFKKYGIEDCIRNVRSAGYMFVTSLETLETVEY